MDNCKDCRWWGWSEKADDSSRKWDIWPYNECRALKTPLDDKNHEAIRCDTFHSDPHDVEDIQTHALFGCIKFEPSIGELP